MKLTGDEAMVKGAAGIRTPYSCNFDTLLLFCWKPNPVSHKLYIIHSLFVQQTVTQTAVLNISLTFRKDNCPYKKGANITEICTYQ